MPEQQREGLGAGYDAGPGLGRQRKRWMTTAGLGPRRDEKMGQVLYFAYGSNLDDEHMRSRCASAQPVARAVLPNYALAFGGFSHRWDGAVASVVRARGARVEGLLYRLDDADLRSLDRFIYRDGAGVALAAFPAGHIAGVLALLRMFVFGTKTIFMDQWNAAEAARLVAEHRATSTSGEKRTARPSRAPMRDSRWRARGSTSSSRSRSGGTWIGITRSR